MALAFQFLVNKIKNQSIPYHFVNFAAKISERAEKRGLKGKMWGDCVKDEKAEEMERRLARIARINADISRFIKFS